MCGIIGYSGHRPAVPVIIEGLKRLEYRGYDSAGVAFIQNHALNVVRAPGKLSQLENKLAGMDATHATSGIGHTRWATHGLPNETNAHPHVDGGRRLALAHNGIIENFQVLKDELLAKGHEFRSQTDTEVLVHLIADLRLDGRSVMAALSAALGQIEGTFAIALVSLDEPGVLYAARKSSPLVLGVGTGENFFASDIPAFLPYTRDVVFIEDGELIRIDSSSWAVYDAYTLAPIAKKIAHINWDVQSAQKDGFKHFMLKEIFEQPRVVTNCLAGRADFKTGRLNLPEIADLDIPERLHIIACGTSFHAGMWGRYLLEKFARIPTQVEIASEFRYRDFIHAKGDLALVISQSGETADTLAGLRLAKESGVPVLGVCNVVGSSVARESGHVIYTQAGPEISVASTKAMCSQMTVLLLLALYWGGRKGLVAPEETAALLAELERLPSLLESSLPGLRSTAQRLSVSYSEARSFFFLGRGLYYPLALEGALKLKEISYIHAEGYAAGEMKHGPIALIDPKFPTFAVALDEPLLPKVKSNLQEVQARGGKVIALTNPGVDLKVDDVWETPALREPLNSFLVLPAVQLLAYEMAVYLGKDVDQPRNLAKSVTVE